MTKELEATIKNMVKRKVRTKVVYIKKMSVFYKIHTTKKVW